MNIEKYKKMYGNVIWTGKPHNFLGMPLNFTRYIITDKKIVIRKGFFNIVEEKIELYKIVDMSKKLPITQRIFGCGTVKLISKDVSSPELELKQVKNPYEVYNSIEDSIEVQKKQYGVLGRDIIGASINVNNDAEDLDLDEIPDNLENN